MVQFQRNGPDLWRARGVWDRGRNTGTRICDRALEDRLPGNGLADDCTGRGLPLPHSRQPAECEVAHEGGSRVGRRAGSRQPAGNWEQTFQDVSV